MSTNQPSLSDVLGTKKAFLFDLFHTLTALEITSIAGRTSTHQILGVDKAAWNEQLERMSRDRVIGRTTDPLAIITNMAHAINPSISAELIQKATKNRMDVFAGAIIRMPAQTQHVLRTLKRSGKRIGLVSNADVMEVAAWAKCSIADVFDSTVFSCSAGCAKPEPEIYEISLRELGVTADESVFIGDGGSNELQGARNLGITTVMITGIIQQLWPERIPERLCHADFVIDALAELIDG